MPLKDKLFRLAFSITGNKEDAEDVVQDVMLQMWRKKNEWNKINNIEGYCLRSARNIALDKIALKDNQADRIPDNIELIDKANNNLTEQIEHAERLKLIYYLINNLPEKQKTIIQLRDIEGLSYKEIASILEVSEEQVKITLFRARKKIKEHFSSIENYGHKRN